MKNKTCINDNTSFYLRKLDKQTRAQTDHGHAHYRRETDIATADARNKKRDAEHSGDRAHDHVHVSRMLAGLWNELALAVAFCSTLRTFLFYHRAIEC